jgi:hypothetical protein
MIAFATGSSATGWRSRVDMEGFLRADAAYASESVPKGSRICGIVRVEDVSH